ncbi:MAG: class B sortase [Oscillospiraceae bacterium]|nr:class B sortase [Oscillospiraceae bacterium]
MKKKLRLILTAALAAVLAVSLTTIVRVQLQYRENAASYEDAARVARFEPPKPAAEQSARPEPAKDTGEAADDPLRKALEAIDLAALQAVNPDVVGWIYIPDTQLSYPLLYGTDNLFYLTHTWDRAYNSGGSIFVDYRCSPGLDTFHTIIYGHRMNNDSMFGTLKYYRNQDFWREHPTIYLVDSSGVHLYDIFAAWEAGVTSIVYEMNLNTPQRQQEFLDTCLSASCLDTGITPDTGDRFLTLSTCTGSGGHATRWVIHSVLTQTYGISEAEPSP